MPLLSGAKLAAELGVSPAQVSHYKSACKITEEPGGGWDLEKVRTQLAANLSTKQGGVPRRGERAQMAQAANTPERVTPKQPRPIASAEAPPAGSIADLELQERAERVRDKRLRNDEREGKLVDRDEWESRTEARFSAEKEALLNWPAGVAIEIAADLGVEERAVHRILDLKIREYLQRRSHTKAEEVVAA